MNVSRFILLAALAACLPVPLRADAAPTGFLDKVYKDKDGHEIKYVVFVPADYKADNPCPLILFLHGAGETKGGTRMPVEVGIGPAIRKREKTFPFITVIPQAQSRGWRADGPSARMALAILEEVQKQYKVDPKRIYLTGLSMGGAGTWSIAAAHPDRWAAIVPLCGGGAPDSVETIKRIPCWAFYGADDRAEGLKKCDETIMGLRAAGARPGYTVYPAVGHNCWDRAYDTDALYDWLLNQKLK
jgi:predicted peptidase